MKKTKITFQFLTYEQRRAKIIANYKKQITYENSSTRIN
jgi:hypothetical protein